MKQYIKKCPQCNKDLTYKSEFNLKISIKKNSKCRSCTVKNRDLNGINNPFYGKKHTKEYKLNQSIKKKGKHYSPNTQFKKGHKINNFSKLSMKQKLINKYGELEGIVKFQKFINLQKLNNSGKNNPMYGKPSPNGSGNGWSGWYKNWFFRSIIELSYMINVIEKYNIKWESAESNKYKVKYLDYLNNERNYFPDFILNNKYVIECKPKRLHKSPIVIAKKKAAIIYFKKLGFIYKLRDCKKLQLNEIKQLLDNNLIKFTEKYNEKFKKYYESCTK